MFIQDNGIGHFKKITVNCGLLDEHHAVLELSKGKLTTNPLQHSGEGIFFTSRLLDAYSVSSGEASLAHDTPIEKLTVLKNKLLANGTLVWMKLANNSERQSKKVFDNYALAENYNFNKTLVAVKLLQYDHEKLISRSQAKRLLARMELFTIVVLDFIDVESIAQAFADEIFRVFVNTYPQIHLFTLNVTIDVQQMISRVLGTIR